MDKETLAKLRKRIKEGGHVVFLGGAGVSTASGISDFRSPQGLYNIHSKYGVPYERMLSHSYFYEHTDTFYDFYWSTMVDLKAKPNKAHYALANFEKNHPEHHLMIITQNIDGLHQEAGSRMVFEAHGSTKRYFCTRCDKKLKISDIPNSGVPHCPECGGLVKPDVVLYEEPLDEDVMESCLNAVKFADILIIGGTSMNVYPIAALPNYFLGGLTIMINKEPTPYDSHCDYVIHEDIGDTLEALLGD